MILEMLTKLLLFLARDGRFASSMVHLRFEGTQLARLSHQLADYRPTDGEPHGQFTVTAFPGFIGRYDPLTQITG